MTDKPLIRLVNATKLYTTDSLATRAISEVSLSVQEGEFLAITGPSGAGKSTLLLVLALLERLSSGTYCLAGHDVAQLAPRDLAYLRNRFLGVVFQHSLLIPDLRVWQNVALPLKYRGVPGAEARRKALEALERVSLSHRAFHFPPELSGGEQQRAAVARALVGEPKLILADEPTGNLDSEHGREVMSLFKEANRQGVTVLMVTHDAQWAGWAKGKVVLRDGQLVEDTRRQP